MSAMLRLLLPLIGYACVATVITAALVFGYLRRSGKLDDETMFRIAALVHDVDLEEIEQSKKAAEPGVPPEEASYAEQQQQFQTMSLHFDVKQKQLADSLVEFDYRLKQLSAATEQYARLRKDVEAYLDAQGKLVLSAAIQAVREQLEQMPPRQSKPMLVKYIEDNRIEEVIMLLGSMKSRSREDILKMFTTVEDTEMLYRIQRKILAGEPVKPFIDDKLKQLEQLKAQDK
jgi:hypothetical protein